MKWKMFYKMELIMGWTGRSDVGKQLEGNSLEEKIRKECKLPPPPPKSTNASIPTAPLNPQMFFPPIHPFLSPPIYPPAPLPILYLPPFSPFSLMLSLASHFNLSIHIHYHLLLLICNSHKLDLAGRDLNDTPH
jgi:hypothetical protein